MGQLDRLVGRCRGLLSLNFLVIIALHYGLMVNAYAAQLGGIVTYTVATFVGCRYVALRDLVSVPVMREGAA